jgi:hypothetical protein
MCLCGYLCPMLKYISWTEYVCMCGYLCPMLEYISWTEYVCVWIPVHYAGIYKLDRVCVCGYLGPMLEYISWTVGSYPLCQAAGQRLHSCIQVHHILTTDQVLGQFVSSNIGRGHRATALALSVPVAAPPHVWH